jgi:hypothetical protein
MTIFCDGEQVLAAAHLEITPEWRGPSPACRRRGCWQLAAARLDRRRD